MHGVVVDCLPEGWIMVFTREHTFLADAYLKSVRDFYAKTALEATKEADAPSEKRTARRQEMPLGSQKKPLPDISNTLHLR
jgi:hypothetical protein